MSYLDQFFYQISGPSNGRTWVFLHGLMGYALNWRKIIQSLEKTERVLVYDQRGHGKSMKPLTGYNREDYADDLYLILQELKWESIILVGHSMGGRVALNFAARYPEKVSKLIIEDIGPDSDPKSAQYYEYLINLPPTPFIDKKSAKEYFDGPFLQQVGNRENTSLLAQYLYSNIEEKPDGTADWRFYKEGVIKSIYTGSSEVLWSEIKSLKMPTLFLRGERSKDLSFETFKKLNNFTPNIHTIEIKNSGHWVHFEQAQQFLEEIKQFADSPF